MSTRDSVRGRVGARLRALRVARGLSIRTLAARTGFSPSFISQVESEGTSLSIGSLETIAADLGVSLSQFFSQIEATPRTVVRRGDRSRFESTWSRGTIELLTDEGPGRTLSAIAVSVEPGGTSGTPVVQREDTVVVVLDGTLALRIGDEETPLQDGDAAYLAAGASVTWANRENALATALVVRVSPREARAGARRTAGGDRPALVWTDGEW